MGVRVQCGALPACVVVMCMRKRMCVRSCARVFVRVREMVRPNGHKSQQVSATFGTEHRRELIFSRAKTVQTALEGHTRCGLVSTWYLQSSGWVLCLFWLSQVGLEWALGWLYKQGLVRFRVGHQFYDWLEGVLRLVWSCVGRVDCQTL